MFLCGSNFVGGALACAPTPTGIENINYVELKNGIYDDLYISKNTDFELSNNCPAQWDFDTILWAKFDNTTNAGNVDWNLETTSHIILKSRTEGNFKWKTIVAKEVKGLDDFVINYPDYFVASGQPVEYAIVPVLYGCEGIYATTRIVSDFDKMFLIEGDTVWGTEITDGYCDTTRNIPSSTVELLNGRYPIFVRNTAANYDTGNCKGSFVPLIDEAGCELAYDKEYDHQRTKFQRDFMDFICDGIPKILKLPDGRLWLAQVTPSPADTANLGYNDREISWPWAEVGSVNSEEDLYYLGFSNIEPEWWNS
ncbi:hypothetical protein IMSAGC019_03713 [Lachnospiraceae bacterium]|nr:hypothetical protein IMSAGC019_03713 [Lachnospiraceae bacterium]